MARLAISPCPNDTFAFYALLHGKTDLAEVPEVGYADIEQMLMWDVRPTQEED